MANTVKLMTLLLLLAGINTAAIAANAESPATAAQTQRSNRKEKLLIAKVQPAKDSKFKTPTKVKEAKKEPAKKDVADTMGNGIKPDNTKLTYEGAPVLDPSRFFGAAAMGYASAKACPEIVSRLFCYCGCDISDSHNSLVDCFTTIHGVDCHICQEEAVMALKMLRENASLSDIQKAVDQQYTSKYPWKEDSPAYIKYKTVRLWKPFAESSNQTSEKAGPPEAAASTDSSVPTKDSSSKKDSKWTPVAKPGFKAPTCCSKEKEKDK